MKHSTTYVEQLLQKGHGYPFWWPDPHNEPAVEIADVGYVQNGAWVRLFNAAKPPGDTSNKFGVPDGYQPLDTGAIQEMIHSAHYPIMSASVSQLNALIDISGAAAVQVGGSFSFTCSEEKGAVLIPGDDILIQDALRKSAFARYIRQRHGSWLAFANEIHDRGIALNDLVLVTGCDMTCTWACAAFSGRSSKICFEFNVGPAGTTQATVGIWRSLENCRSIEGHSGPQKRISLSNGHTNDSDADETISRLGAPLRNQCVFLRGYKMCDRKTKRFWRRKRHYDGFDDVQPRSGKKTDGTDGPGPRPRGSPSSGDSNSSQPSSGRTDEGSGKGSSRFAEKTNEQSGPSSGSPETDSFGAGSLDCEDDEELDLFLQLNQNKDPTPYDILLGYILENSTAKLALVHDDDLCAVIRGLDFVDDFEKGICEEAPTIFVEEEVGMLETTYRVLTRSPGPSGSVPAAYALRESNKRQLSVGMHVLSPKSKSGHSARTTSFLPLFSETLHGERDLLEHFSLDSTNSQYQQGGSVPRIDHVRRNSFDNHPGATLSNQSKLSSTVSLGDSNDILKTGVFIAGTDGSAVRETLVVKEEGSTATHYLLGNCIGQGRSGSVYRALNLNTGQTVAVKQIRLENLSKIDVAKLILEAEIVKRLTHPSIVKYESITRDSDTLNIVLEYVENGSLAQTLKAFGKLNERLVAIYVIKILEGLQYLHASQVVHGDLKAANILTTKTGNVRLSDFGLSLSLRVVAKSENGAVCAPNWTAPEIIELKGASPASDIWSLACTIIELLTTHPPYYDIKNGMSVMFRIVEDLMPPIPDGTSDPLKDFLSLCFNKNPEERPSTETLFEHPWLRRLQPQDSIPFIRRVSTDLQRNDVARQISFLDMDDDALGSPRSSNGPNLSSEPASSRPNIFDSPEPLFLEPPKPTTLRRHTFVESMVMQATTCQVCSQPVKKIAMFCVGCNLTSHSTCTDDASGTCNLQTQVTRTSQDLQREAVIHQRTSTPTANELPGSSPKHSERLLRSSPPERLLFFGKKNSKRSGVIISPTIPSVPYIHSVDPKDDEINPPKRTLFPRLWERDDKSRSSASTASSRQSSSASSGATAVGSVSSNITKVGERSSGRASDAPVIHHAPEITELSEDLMGDDTEEVYMKRKGARWGKKSTESSRNECVVQ